jgi:hypothetical protein
MDPIATLKTNDKQQPPFSFDPFQELPQPGSSSGHLDTPAGGRVETSRLTLGGTYSSVHRRLPFRMRHHVGEAEEHSGDPLHGSSRWSISTGFIYPKYTDTYVIPSSQPGAFNIAPNLSSFHENHFSSDSAAFRRHDEVDEEGEDDDFCTARDNLPWRRSYNSHKVAKELGTTLYPSCPLTDSSFTTLPEEVDLRMYITFRERRALCPMSRDLLLKATEFLVEFIRQKGGLQCEQKFLREARSRLSAFGWAHGEEEVRFFSLSLCQLCRRHNYLSGKNFGLETAPDFACISPVS